MDLKIAFVQMALHRTQDRHSFFVLGMSIESLVDQTMTKTPATADRAPKYSTNILYRPLIFVQIFLLSSQENDHVEDIHDAEISS